MNTNTIDTEKTPETSALQPKSKRTPPRKPRPHSIRGYLSGTIGKKMGLTVESTKRDDGERVYSISK